jgi:hypothetical protein
MMKVENVRGRCVVERWVGRPALDVEQTSCTEESTAWYKALLYWPKDAWEIRRFNTTGDGNEHPANIPFRSSGARPNESAHRRP